MAILGSTSWGSVRYGRNAHAPGLLMQMSASGQYAHPLSRPVERKLLEARDPANTEVRKQKIPGIRKRTISPINFGFALFFTIIIEDLKDH